MTLWVFTRCRLHSKSLQSYLTLWDPRDCSPPGSSVHGIFQARILSGLPCPPPGDWLIQGSNLCLLHFRCILCCLSNLGSPVYEMKVKVKVTQLCPTLCDPMDYTVHGILQARITGVGSLSLLQGIFPIQGSNPGLLHCRRILYQLSHKGSPRILEWVAYPFSRGSSQPSSQTGVSCIAARFFTNWAIRDIFISLINTRYIPDISAIYQVSLWDNQSISGIYRDIPDISEKYQVYQGYQGYTRYIPDISQISLWDNQAQISPLTLGPTSTGWLSLWRGSLNIGKMMWRQRVVWNIYKPGNTRGC